MWDGEPKSQAQTTEGMFKACSFNMADVSKAVGGSILKVAIPIPCSGRTPQGAGYNSQSCPFNGARRGSPPARLSNAPCAARCAALHASGRGAPLALTLPCAPPPPPHTHRVV